MMRKYLFAALAALSALSLSAPAEASSGVFITYGSGYGYDRGYYDNYRGNYYRGGRGYYSDDYYYRPRYRGYRSYRDYKGYRDDRRFYRYRHDGYRGGYRGKRFRNRY